MRRSTRPALPAILLTALAVAVASCQNGGSEVPAEWDGRAGPLPQRGHAWVVFDADTVVAEIADTPEARERGLMYREELSDGEGMLFVFEETAPQSFWMRNTYIPLDIAFLDERQYIVDIQPMEPEDEEFTDSAAPAMFALEVRQGWFEEQGIEVGDRASIVFGRR